MLNKLFGGKDEQPSRKPDRGHLERTLARLALDRPESPWAALYTTNGEMLACFPTTSSLDQDRRAAMSAALLSLGERVAHELGSGEFRYNLLAGSQETSLLLALDGDTLLMLSAASDCSLDALLEKAQRGAVEINREG